MKIILQRNSFDIQGKTPFDHHGKLKDVMVEIRKENYEGVQSNL